MNKILFIICDGLSDRPIDELNGRTPLETAFTPNMDRLAGSGMVGLMHTVDIGIRPGSDIAHLSIFGYDINKFYPGRGPFEAAGLDMDIKPEDVALRGNFATVNDKLVVLDRRAGRIEKTEKLITAINKISLKNTKIILKKGLSHRVAIIFRGKNLDGNISDVDPHQTGVKILASKPKTKESNAKRTAEILNEFTQKTYQVLTNHPVNKKRQNKNLFPANIVLTRGAGKLPYIPSFFEKYGLKSACIAGAGLYKGIGKILGMKVFEIAGATGKPDSNLGAKIRKALGIFSDYDFVFIHIKACDNLAEDGDYLGKTKFIEKIDRSLKPIIGRNNFLVVLTADHTTSSILKRHTADPVPILICGKNIPSDHVNNFCENTAYQGRLGHIKGANLMPIIMDITGSSKIIGA